MNDTKRSPLFGRYESVEGVVHRIERGGALVRIPRACSQAADCRACGSCDTSDRTTLIRASLPTDVSLSQDERVIVRRFLLNPALAGGVVFGLPLAAAVAATAIAAHFFGLDPDSPAGVMTAFAALLAGFGVAWLAERWLRAHRPSSLAKRPAE